MSTQLQVVRHAAASPLRCPFCHDELSTRLDDWVACRECLARHHVACWRDHRACAFCGRREFVSSASPTRVWAATPPAVAGDHLGTITLGVYLGTILGFVPAVLVTMLVGAILSPIPPVQVIVGVAVFLAGFFGSGYIGARAAHHFTR